MSLVRRPTRSTRTGGSHLRRAAGNGNADVYILNPETRTAEPFVATAEFREETPMFSPDGNWIAYVSNQSGVRDVWIARYPDADNPTKVSTAGGTEPVWSRYGGELFYRESNRMMAVTFTDGPGNPDAPQQLFVDDFERGWMVGGSPAYDVSLDGRFLMVRRKNPVTPNLIRVVFNWPDVFGLDEE